MVKITGKTYQAREWIKSCGFAWNSEEKAYFGNAEAKTELERTSTATYSRANGKLLAALTVEDVGE
jgi:hypothetical protein